MAAHERILRLRKAQPTSATCDEEATEDEENENEQDFILSDEEIQEDHVDDKKSVSSGKKCSSCGVIISNASNLRRHVILRHTGAKFSCIYCSQRFEIQNHLRSHIATEHPRTLRCISVPNCTYTAKSTKNMTQHAIQAHSGDVVLCSVEGCGYLAKYRCLQRHMKEVHSQLLQAINRQSSREEESTTSSSASSTSGRRVGEAQEEICPSALPGERGFSCSQCGRVSKNLPALKKHVARVHEKRYNEKKPEKKFACKVEGCKKKFTTLGRLTDHEITHTDSRPFSCGRCKRSYKARADFAVHLRKYHAMSIKDLDLANNIFCSNASAVEQDILKDD